MNNWLQITSGRGPSECCWVAQRVLDRIREDAKAQSLTVTILDIVPDENENGLKSALLSLSGDEQAVRNFIVPWEGTIQWIGASPYRPKHKRKNWYVGVNSLSASDTQAFSHKDVKIETMRGSGPGGQHVNTTDSAVRATHILTGISVVAREERSQAQNRKLALCRLSQRLAQETEQVRDRDRKHQWGHHDSLERGNPARTFEGESFKERRVHP